MGLKRWKIQPFYIKSAVVIEVVLKRPEGEGFEVGTGVGTHGEFSDHLPKLNHGYYPNTAPSFQSRSKITSLYGTVHVRRLRT